MGAQALHPTLLPLLEAALGVRALTITLQGNATIVNLPLPHWVVAYGPSLLVTILFCAQAIWVQRQHIKKLVQQAEAVQKQMPQRKRQSVHTVVVRPHIMRFAACLVLMAVGATVFSAYI